MKHKEFERQIREIIPRPAPETTDALYQMGVEALEGRPQDILVAFDFISRHFGRETLQKTYEIIRHGAAALPDELVAAAVFLHNGDTPTRIARLAEAGDLMCFYCPKEKGEVSPLALCSVLEAGKRLDSFTIQFGKFSPRDILAHAKAYAKQHGGSVTEAFECVSAQGVVNGDLSAGQKVIAGRWPKMTSALAAIYGSCPAVAAHITFDVDHDRAAIEYNPLWQKLHTEQRRQARRGKPPKNFCQER